MHLFGKRLRPDGKIGVTPHNPEAGRRTAVIASVENRSMLLVASADYAGTNEEFAREVRDIGYATKHGLPVIMPAGWTIRPL